MESPALENKKIVELSKSVGVIYHGKGAVPAANSLLNYWKLKPGRLFHAAVEQAYFDKLIPLDAYKKWEQVNKDWFEKRKLKAKMRREQSRIWLAKMEAELKKEEVK